LRKAKSSPSQPLLAATLKHNTMKKLFKYSFLLLIIIIISCDKDTIEIEKTLIVGISDSKMIIKDIDPDTIITSWEIKSNYSIDINYDYTDDINVSVLNQYMFGGMSLWNSELKIETLNSETFVMVDSIYPQVLSFGDTISIQENWRNGSLLLLHSSEGCCPPTGNSYHEGYWKEKNENYIGIRYQDRLGWIKIGVPGYTSIKIYKYALRK
jgi:hypothetical protein